MKIPNPVLNAQIFYAAKKKGTHACPSLLLIANVKTMHIFIESSGASLRVKDGIFEVRRVDAKKLLQKTEYAPSELRSIWAHSGTLITVAALELAGKYNIDVVFTNILGEPLGRFVPHEPSSTTLTQKAQVIVSQQPAAVQWVKQWVAQKVQNQQDFLRELMSRRSGAMVASIEKSVIILLNCQRSIEALEGQHVDDIADKLRGLEGTAGRTYFAALSTLLPKRYRFEGRSMRPALDAFNSFLNYGYAILYTKVEAALTRAGISPWLGFLHTDGYKRRSMVFDFIEPWRHHVERVVVRLCTEKAMSAKKHTQPGEMGGVLLGSEGRRLLVPALQRHLEDKKMAWGKGRYTPELLLKLNAEQFATGLRREAKVDEENLLAAFVLN